MSDEQELIKLHDRAAWQAHCWRIAQADLEGKRDEVVPAAPDPDRDDAIAGYESVMSRLRAEEAAEHNEMMRLRKLIGRDPPRRTKKAAGK